MKKRVLLSSLIPHPLLMISPRWRKVLRDLWINKTRTLLVVLSIAVGVAALGMVMGAQIIVDQDLPSAYQAIKPTDATVLTLNTFNEDMVETIRNVPGVAEAEGRRAVVVRFRSPTTGNWFNMQLFAVSDFEHMRLNQLALEAGEWPPPEKQILVERSTLNATFGLEGITIGDSLEIEPPDGKPRTVGIAGITHDISQIPAFLVGVAYGYITYDTLAWLGENRDYNQLFFTVEDRQLQANGLSDVPLLAEHIKEVGATIQSQMERGGVLVLLVLVPNPGDHPAQSFLDALSYILGAMGILSLVLSGFLIVNTLAAILTQQVRQIGIMKAIGARTRQITSLYLSMVFAFGLLALFVAVPVGAIGAWILANIFGWMLNFDVSGIAFNPPVILTQILVGLTVPFAAALYPVITGSRTTVREAISEYGMGKGQFGHSVLDNVVVGLRTIIPMGRPMQISVRNTFRRKGRLALTLITLSLASTIFISIFSVRASLQQTLDDSLRYFDYDVQIQFSRPYRVERILQVLEGMPEVVAAESWAIGNVRRVYNDGREGENILAYAPPADSALIKPTLIAGRWLRPGDTNQIVVNNDVLRDNEDIVVGSQLRLKIGGRETTWTVVGIVRSGFPQPAVYASYDYFSWASNEVGLGQLVVLRTNPNDPVSQIRIGEKLQEKYQNAGFRVEIMQSVAQLKMIISTVFNVIIFFLLFMAVVLGAVGGLGLMGTMSINVIERSREIGVMRAVGASDGIVLRIVLVEGVLIGVISWLIGSVIAFPASKILADQVGLLLLQAKPNFIFSVSGMMLWLFTVIVLAGIASYLPARSASQITVREVLSYE